MNNFRRDEHGLIIEYGIWISRDLEKRPKKNRLGEDVYLLPDGRIVRDEDKIIAAQQIWRERSYAPPESLFEKRGYMYRYALKSWIKDRTSH